jgi:hypothetical protein
LRDLDLRPKFRYSVLRVYVHEASIKCHSVLIGLFQCFTVTAREDDLCDMTKDSHCRSERSTMRNATLAIVSLLTLSLLSPSRVSSFALPARCSDISRRGRSLIGRNDYSHEFAPSKADALRLRSSKDDDNAAVDGTGRGLVVMAISLFACVWIFSIPPEFRRAHICTSDRPSVGADGTSTCVPLGAWAEDVADYYKGGGGVHFDFSIDQSTRDFWSGGR